ncbi:hypothetical protein [Prosthecobacter fluviatilis]|uniref:Uncharacterized protein n=1 Tax=Prosthecobacter fluviatilis TaxID=445931 RepID=A0ABW0KXV2_9BACT
MKVEIRTFYEDHKNGELLETWRLGSNGHATCDDSSKQAEVEQDGIIGKGGRKYFPKDGEAFLRNYPYEYANSSFTRAIIIE